jgi:hypothetical protein
MNQWWKQYNINKKQDEENENKPLLNKEKWNKNLKEYKWRRIK